jgi:hypothetical protein
MNIKRLNMRNCPDCLPLEDAIVSVGCRDAFDSARKHPESYIIFSFNPKKYITLIFCDAYGFGNS